MGCIQTKTNNLYNQVTGPPTGPPTQQIPLKQPSPLNYSDTLSFYHQFYAPFKTAQSIEQIKRQSELNQPLFWFLNKPAHTQSLSYEISKFWLHLQRMSHDFQSAVSLVSNEISKFKNSIKCSIAGQQVNSLQNVEIRNVGEWCRRQHIMSSIINFTLRQFNCVAWNQIIYILMLVHRRVRENQKQRYGLTFDAQVLLTDANFNLLRDNVGQTIQLLKPLELDIIQSIMSPPQGYQSVKLQFSNYTTYSYFDIKQSRIIYSLSTMKIDSVSGDVITLKNGESSLQRMVAQWDYKQFGVLLSSKYFRQVMNSVSNLNVDLLVEARRLMNEDRYKEASEKYKQCMGLLKVDELEKWLYLSLEYAQCLELLGQWNQPKHIISVALKNCQDRSISQSLTTLLKMVHTYWEMKSKTLRFNTLSYSTRELGEPKSMEDIRYHLAQYRCLMLTGLDTPDISSLKQALRYCPLKHYSMLVDDVPNSCFQKVKIVQRRIFQQKFEDALVDLSEAETLSQNELPYLRHYLVFLRGYIWLCQGMRMGDKRLTKIKEGLQLVINAMNILNGSDDKMEEYYSLYYSVKIGTEDYLNRISDSIKFGRMSSELRV